MSRIRSNWALACASRAVAACRAACAWPRPATCSVARRRQSSCVLLDGVVDVDQDLRNASRRLRGQGCLVDGLDYAVEQRLRRRGLGSDLDGGQARRASWQRPLPSCRRCRSRREPVHRRPRPRSMRFDTRSRGAWAGFLGWPVSECLARLRRQACAVASASGQKPVKDACNRFRPTKPVSRNQYGFTQMPSDRLTRTTVPANAMTARSMFMRCLL